MDASVAPSRERFIDAALVVMSTRGIAASTTKLIAAQAGLSEALLYKHFSDKQQLFLAVLEERLPRPRFDPNASRGEDLAEGLTALVEQLMAFFAASFPISASIFGTPELLAQHREGIAAHGHGPHEPVSVVMAYLDAERETGRVRTDADTASVARALVGAAFHQGFLAAFSGADAVPDARAVAAGIAAVVLPALTR